MSVAGDLIDDLSISADFKIKATAGLCSLLFVGVVLVVGFIGGGSSIERASFENNLKHDTKLERTVYGGVPEPREG